MSAPEKPVEYAWTKIWNAREAALVPILGPPGNVVFHAPIPFEARAMGGTADVAQFPDFVPGATYVTAELTGKEVGQLPGSLGHYELMMCARHELPRAADFIARLACHTCQAVLEPGHTVEIGGYFKDSTLRGILFAHPGELPLRFELFNQRCGILLCIGITAEELAFCRARSGLQVLGFLKQHGVFPYTVPDRPSVPLPP